MGAHYCARRRESLGTRLGVVPSIVLFSAFSLTSALILASLHLKHTEGLLVTGIHYCSVQVITISIVLFCGDITMQEGYYLVLKCCLLLSVVSSDELKVIERSLPKEFKQEMEREFFKGLEIEFHASGYEAVEVTTTCLRIAVGYLEKVILIINHCRTCADRHGDFSVRI